MATKMNTTDPDILGSLPALRRAARRARRLALQTGTPCYVMCGGKIVNIARKRRVGKRRASPGKHGRKDP